MARNFQQLWKEVINAIDEAAAVLALVKILIDREGRAFALGLSPEDAEHCIDILDRVSHDPCLQPVSAFSHDFVRVSKVGISKRLSRNRLSSSR